LDLPLNAKNVQKKYEMYNIITVGIMYQTSSWKCIYKYLLHTWLNKKLNLVEVYGTVGRYISRHHGEWKCLEWFSYCYRVKYKIK